MTDHEQDRAEHWSELLALLHGLGDSADEELPTAPAVSAVGTLLDDLAAPSHPTWDVGALDGAQVALDAALDEAVNGLDSHRLLVDDLQGAHAALSTWHGETLQSIESVHAQLMEVRSSLHSFDQDLSHDRHTLRDQATSTRTTIEGFSHETHGRHAQETHGAIQSLVEAIESRGRAAIDHAFEGIEGQVSGAFEHLEQDVQAHSSGLESFVTRAVLESADRITHDTLEEVKRGFQQLLHHGVEVLVSEVAVQAVTMGVGSTVTVTLSPLVPELLAARTGLRAINFVLDIFD